MENENRSRLVAGATRTLAVIGFIAVIIAGLWGTVSVARGVPGAFSALASAIVSLTSIFVPADEALTVSVPSLTVNSGESFAVSWNHDNQGSEGTYTFRYQCAPGVSFTSPTQASPTTEVFCNVPFNFLNAGDSIIVMPTSDENRFVDVTLFIDFTPQGASTPTVTGSTSITIVNEDVSSSPGTTNNNGQPGGTSGTGSTPRPGAEQNDLQQIGSSSEPTTSDPNGFVDLRVRLIEIGVVDKVTGEFTASSTPSRNMIGKRVAARFAVDNLGTRTSDQWSFNAVLPTFPSHVYSSPTQPALGPGDRIEFTLGFDSFEQDNEGTLTVNVDPVNRINESNKNNNILRETIIVTE